ncbi:MAG: hypothetical protein ACRD9Q_03005 [Nitrososphaeraceae archaeon]
MGIFRTAREESEAVSTGKQAPRNIDRKNTRIAKAMEYSDSIQKVLDGWDRNLEKIKNLIKDKLIQLDEQGADEYTKEYHVRKILRKWGGPAALYKDFIPKS